MLRLRPGRRETTAVLILAPLLLAAACGGDPAPPADNAVTLPLPAGDVEAGRQTFAAKGCTLCHAATGESRLPTPVSTTPGPEIGSPQRDLSDSELIASILLPSHRRDAPGPDSATPSAMSDYSDVLTLRDLGDLRAYIRYLEE